MRTALVKKLVSTTAGDPRALAPVRLSKEQAQLFADDMSKLHKALSEELTVMQSQRQERKAHDTL